MRSGRGKGIGLVYINSTMAYFFACTGLPHEHIFGPILLSWLAVGDEEVGIVLFLGVDSPSVEEASRFALVLTLGGELRAVDSSVSSPLNSSNFICHDGSRTALCRADVGISSFRLRTGDFVVVLVISSLPRDMWRGSQSSIAAGVFRPTENEILRSS